MAKRSNPDFLNGVPEMTILKLLESQPMYGYELVQSIRLRSDNRLNFGEGCIYPLLHRMEKEGLLSSRKETVSGRERIIYRTTRAGKKRLQVTVQAWQETVQGVQAVLLGVQYGT
ncbi:MAG: PadR family transcriptional regulator [Pirellula sp.]|nr:PadR family transcriptional regulator [Pirellula sp.]